MIAPPRLRKCIAISVLAVATLAVASVSTGHTPASTDVQRSSTIPVTEYRWTAPADLNGTFALRLGIEVTTPTHCTTHTEAVGAFDPANPVAFWRKAQTADGDFILNAAAWTRAGQVHAGSTADSRRASTIDGRWRAFPSGGLNVERSFEVTWATFGVGLGHDAELDSPLTIEVDCDAAFEITERQAGTGGRSFTQGTLKGGAGATANVPLDGASASVDDAMEVQIDAQHTAFQAAFSAPEARYGHLELHHPNGTARWELGPDGDRNAELRGPGGAYRVELTRTAMGVNDDVEGILVGMDPVDSLDEGL